MVKRSETNNIVKYYNDSESSHRFEWLPAQAQTVIASVAYQYGSLSSEVPNFWKQAVTHDWQAMYNNLMDFEDIYPTRRKKEAKLIKEIL